MRIAVALLLTCSLFAVFRQVAVAQELGQNATVDSGESWSYEQNYPERPDPRAIIQQKAMIRAQQRMDRMAAMQWYGMSNARPTASATPFMGMYSPAWQVPGGRPFAWYYSMRSPVIIVR